ncbi:MAG: imidazole glycerol phosphate synthase subunit HisH [Pseudomonadota bacterium]
MTQQTLAIIDYGSGNLRSAAKAFEHVIEEKQLDIRVIVTNSAEDVRRADRIVLPGQGSFGDCMQGLQSLEGMIDALESRVLKDKKPFLGICVGMQLLADRGLEHGEHKGLGWISGDIVPIKPSNSSVKIPHMGWNTVDYTDHAQSCASFLNSASKTKENNKNKAPFFYFVHSFMFDSKEEENILGFCHYDGAVTAIVGRDNILGVQFHPEKSQADGLDLLNGFLQWQTNI